MAAEVIPFRIEVPDVDLADLRDRLRRTRWPEPETVPDRPQGVPLSYLRELCRYWAEDYPGWGIEKIAGAWAELMARLGYTRYGAAGSDWGTSISTLLGQRDPAHGAGIHLIPRSRRPRQAAMTARRRNTPRSPTSGTRRNARAVIPRSKPPGRRPSVTR